MNNDDEKKTHIELLLSNLFNALWSPNDAKGMARFFFWIQYISYFNFGLDADDGDVQQPIMYQFSTCICRFWTSKNQPNQLVVWLSAA